MSSLKQKAIAGASWSLIGKMAGQISHFIFGIILARLLLPEEYGLVAMAMVFISISQPFINSGFGIAIIQRKKISNTDLSTVFFMNLGVSIICYVALFFGAELIASFFNQPQLAAIIKVLSLTTILFAFSIVQDSLIQRDINFKTKSRIELVSQTLSSIIAIYLAYNGHGVWSIVWKTLLNQVFNNIQLWLYNNWVPSLVFSINSFRTLFAFSSKLLLSNLLFRAHQETFKLIIGKFFPAAELGYFTRAEQFKNLPSNTISRSLLTFSIPVFSKMQSDPERLKNAILKVIRIVMFFNINMMMFLGIIAEPMIIVFLGDNWTGTIPYLQLLIFVGLFAPMRSINISVLTSLGRSDLKLKAELLNKLIEIPSFLLAIFVGIKAMIICMIATSFISLLINIYFTKNLINLGLLEQLKSIYKSCIIAVILVVTLYPLANLFPDINKIVLLSLLSLIALTLVYILSRLMKMEEYFELKEIFLIIKKKVITYK